MEKQVIQPPYYAVIFTSIRTSCNDRYNETSKRMLALAKQQEGFLGIESARNENAIGHFLFEDGEKAKQILEQNNIEVLAIREILVQKLKQDVPGQLGKFARIMEQNGINIKVMYSDHYNQLILVVDDFEKGSIISQNWKNRLYQ